MNQFKYYEMVISHTSESTNSPLAYYIFSHKHMEGNRDNISGYHHTRKTSVDSLDLLGVWGGLFF